MMPKTWWWTPSNFKDTWFRPRDRCSRWYFLNGRNSVTSLIWWWGLPPRKFRLTFQPAIKLLMLTTSAYQFQGEVNNWAVSGTWGFCYIPLFDRQPVSVDELISSERTRKPLNTLAKRENVQTEFQQRCCCTWRSPNVIQREDCTKKNRSEMQRFLKQYHCLPWSWCTFSYLLVDDDASQHYSVGSVVVER